MSRHFLLESTLQSFTRAMAKALVSEQVAKQPGLLQALDPRIRVIGILMLVVAVVVSRRLEVIALLFLVTVVLAILSKVRLMSLLQRVWLVILGFTGLIALPAVFITPGRPVFAIPILHLSGTATGVRAAALLILRVETAVTLTTVLVLCTPWNHILKALRWLRLPAEAVTMVAMTHRYAFLLIETANQMFESRKSRSIGVLPGPETRRMTAQTAGVLLSKSIELSHEVYLAMLSRGFRGEIRLLADFEMKFWDYCALTAFVLAACTAVWVGR